MPLHVLWPGGHPHAPFVQAWPPAHVFMHEPQLNGSFSRSAQLFPHAMVPPIQVAEQTLCEQKGVAPLQIVPQVPQFIGSEVEFTHAEPQALRPPVHAHWLPVQTCEFAHMVPQAPQLRRSFVMFAQTLPVSVVQVLRPDISQVA
jgi:hypothetical protein